MSWTRNLIGILLEIVWPWFQKHVWPLIREHVIALFEDFVRDIRRRIEEYLARRRQREEEVRENAERAERRAAATGDRAEAEGQRRIAEVWRTVAEDMRRENELLSGQLDAVLNEAEQLKGRLRSGIELGSKGNQPALLLDGRPQSLPPPDEKRTITCPACDATIEV